EQCEMLDQALQAMVTVNAGNVEHSCGVSVYYPYTNKDYYKKAGQTLCRDIFDSEGYRNYMERYTGIWISGNQTADEDWILSETAVEEQELTLLLSDEQLENYASASYTILEKNEDDTFSPVLNSVKIDPDENGVLHVPKEMQLFYLWADGAQTQTVWPVEELNSADQKTYYRTKYTGLYSQSDFFGSENIWVLFYVTPEGETVIQSVEARNESDQPSGKDTMDLEHWHIIGYNEWRYQFRAGPEGEPVSYTEWIPVTGVYEAHLVDFSESISFHRENLKNSSTRYYCQIIVQTTDGKEYASDLTELNPFGVQSTITADTEHGRLRFSRFEDHLELIAYEGEDTVLEIPDEIYGIPVTVIRDQAFRNQASLEEVQMPDCVIQTGERVFMGCTKLAKLRLSEGLTELNGYMFRDCGALTELQIPAQVTRIGAGCFYHCESLTDFEIPEQVTYIGTSAFARCPNLKRLRISSSVSVIQPEAFYNSHQLHLEIDENNTSYGLKDGVLFTSDGKQLLEAPGGVLEEITVYQVPEGTEQIAKGAFMNAQKLTEVRFPEGLLAIEDEAFCFCQQLEAPVFPESLESIGHNAFSRGGYLPSENSWKQIFFGKNFSFLGVNAFQGRRVEKFVTAPENPYYCEVDGMLCAKAKDVLLRVPDAKAPVLRIPEGISSIEAGALETAGNITELILSDSVKTIDQEAGLSMQEQLSGIYLGKDFSDIGILRGCQSLKTLEISRENQKYRTKDGTVYDSDQKVLLFYPIAQAKKVLVVPEGVTEIEAGSFGVRSILSTSGNETLEEIRLPSSLEMIWYFSFQSEGGTFDNLRALKRIQVAEGNQVYQSLDGLLYSGGMTKLQYIPRGIEGTIVLPDTIKEIAANAIGNSGAYSEIVIREGVSRIREGNIFQWFNWNSEKKLKVHLPESLKRIDTVETGTPGQVELYVRAGSFAEQWAKENGYTYYIENSQ
ncbi:MAG: leucine-rich repeat protein, partial [Blautia sp.]|nr:leucine-rich repeat protein [Blautia sp.]